MAYFAPYIDNSGLHTPAYQDILDELVAQFQGIYGADVYLGNDSADYQFLSVIALKLSDTMQAVELAYNSRSPSSAIRAALDGLIKLNGMRRTPASYSTCQVTLTGITGTTIPRGVVVDDNGYKWDLPVSTTIGGGGTVTVTATCQTIGAITALTGTITTIATPTAGWTSVTNTVPAVSGQPAETDAQVRSRQAISTALPSLTLFEGTQAAIAALSGVSRSRCYENDTNIADANGVPAHSIHCVVEGAADEDVAEVIRANKGPGCGTDGTTTVTLTDTYGMPIDIKFSRPTPVPIHVALAVTALSGYTSATTDAIKAALAAYLNGLHIGEDVTISALYAVAMSASPTMTAPLFSITALAADTSSPPAGATDIVVAFDEVASGDADDITVTVT